MDNPIIHIMACYLGGALFGSTILVATDMALRRRFSWSNLIPDWKPVVGMLPPILFAMAFVYGRAEWTSHNLILAMATAGMATYIVAMLIERAHKMHRFQEMCEFNLYLVDSIHTLEDSIREGLIAGKPEAIRDSYVAWQRARSEKLQALLKDHGTADEIARRLR